MLCRNDGLLREPKIGSFGALVFWHTVIFFVLLNSCRGQSQEVEPSRTIVTSVGDDVILPCHLEPALDAFSMSLEWGRPDLQPRFVHVWHEGQNLLDDQNPSYKGRTSVSAEKLKHGDLSLTLTGVKLSDNGKYRCYIPSQDKKSTVELVVGSVSSPVIARININSSSVVLQCESAGWYPEPEVFWLDGEGNLLSDGPTETVRGPDDLYTVSSRVTVEKRHSNSFTCRVHQKNINQTRETHIYVSADYVEATCSSAACIIIIVVVVLICVLAAAFVVWKRRQNQTKDTKMTCEDEQLMGKWKKLENLEEKKEKLEEMLKEKEEEQINVELVVEKLTEQRNELQKQSEQLKHQKEEMEKKIKEIDGKLQSVGKIEGSDQSFDLKEIILMAKNQLNAQKQENEKFHLETQKILSNTTSLFNRMTDRKKDVEKHMEEIKEQLEEIQRKLQSEHKERTSHI